MVWACDVKLWSLETRIEKSLSYSILFYSYSLYLCLTLYGNECGVTKKNSEMFRGYKRKKKRIEKQSGKSAFLRVFYHRTTNNNLQCPPENFEKTVNFMIIIYVVETSYLNYVWHCIQPLQHCATLWKTTKTYLQWCYSGK